MNRRVAKYIDGSFVAGWIYQDALNPVAEIDGSGNTVSRFVYGTKPHVPDFMIRGGVTYAIVSDHLGSVRWVVDTTDGSVVQAISYNTYGVIESNTNPGFQPFGYAGGLYDPDTQLVRFGARDYLPGIGRWLARDPAGFAGGSANLYQYVNGDPVNLVDSTGHAAIGAILVSYAIVGVVAAVGNGLNNAYATRESGRHWDAFLIGAKYGVLNAVPLGGFKGGELTARANLEACLVDPPDVQRYIDNASYGNGSASLITGVAAFIPGAGTAVGVVSSLSGEFISYNFSLFGEEADRHAEANKGLADQWQKNNRRRAINPRDFRNSNSP